MVRELYKTYDPYAWSDVLNRRKLEREDLRIVDEAGEFGMREGFVVPIYQLNGYFGLVSAAGGKLELTEQMRSVLQLTRSMSTTRWRACIAPCASKRPGCRRARSNA